MRSDDKPSKQHRWHPADYTKHTRDENGNLATALQENSNGRQANRQYGKRKVVWSWFVTSHHIGCCY